MPIWWQIIFLLAVAIVIADVVTRIIMGRRRRRERDRERLRWEARWELQKYWDYMRELGAEEAGGELLTKIEKPEQLRRVNKKLEKSLWQE